MENNKVKELVEKAGWTATDLAKNADISHNTALQLIRGMTTRYDIDILKKVASALGVTVGELFS